MRSLFAAFNGIETFFLICAIVGGLFVLFRLFMMLIGMDHDGHGDFSSDGHDFSDHHSDSDIGFKLLSLHGLTSFFMMFGLVGLALYRQSRVGTLVSMVGAVVAGLVSVWIIKKLFGLVVKLQSSGTITIEKAVGAQGKVYLTIPANGTGRVLVKVQNSLREFDASSQGDEEIASDTPIRVVWVDGNVLVVEKI